MRLGAKRRRPMDYQLLTLALTLLGFGFVMLASASAIFADQKFHDPLKFIKLQAVWCMGGLILMTFFSRVNYNRLREWSWLLLAVTIFLLTMVLFTAPIAGVNRWLRLGAVRFQPSELAKIALILFIADYLDRKRSKVATLMQGTIVPWTVVGLVLILIILGKDLGTPALLFGVVLMLLFIGGTKPRHLGGTLALAVPVFAVAILLEPYRVKRVLNFMSPFRDASGAGYQLSRSLMAVGSGGWLGKGLGASELKLLYLPDAHTDFIFPVLCEELGLLGALILLGLFAVFLIRGARTASRAPNLYGTLLASGLTFLICLQAFFNISMSIGLLPTKGLPLPFFSYGGSSMFITLSAAGILLNISRYATETSSVRR